MRRNLINLLGVVGKSRREIRMRYSAHAYMARDSSKAIVAAVHLTQDGIACEDDSPTVLDGPFDGEELGELVVKAARSAGHVERHLRDRKISDWGALRASGVRSGRAFEANYILIDLHSVNDANLVLELTGHPEKDAVLRVTSRISSTAPNRMIGDLVLKTFTACSDRKV